MEQCPPEEVVNLVTSTVAAQLEDAGKALGDDLKRQENVWDAAVEKIDEKIRAREEEEETKSVTSRKTTRTARSNRTKKSKK